MRGGNSVRGQGERVERQRKHCASAEGCHCLGKNKYEVSGAGETLNFSIQTNVDFTVSTNVDWITQTNTRGLVEYPLSFNITPNENDNSRTGIITITAANNKQEITVE